MFNLFRALIAFAYVLCFLFAVPQVHACRAWMYQGFLFDSSPQHPSRVVPETLPDADVVAEVVMMDASTVNIVKVIKTTDERVRHGEEITVKFADVLNTEKGLAFAVRCDVIIYKKGDKGTIIAKTGTDKEGRLVLCPYTYSDQYPIESPYFYDCSADGVAGEKKNTPAVKKNDVPEKGDNVKRDSAKAMELFQLGEKYLRDNNEPEAIKHFHLAAQEDTALLMQIGLLYLYGKDGIKHNNDEAVKWFRLGAESGNEYAIGYLTLMYIDGRGVPQSDEEAAKWYQIDAESGDRASKAALEILQNRAKKEAE